MTRRGAGADGWSVRGLRAWRFALGLALLAGVVCAEPAQPPRHAGDTVDRADGEPEQSADEEIDAAIGPRQVETLVVTASRSEQALIDAPVSITVVGEQQVETSGADNLADLLRGVPGLNVVQLSARNLSFVTRTPAGALSNSQLALLDGRSLYQDFFGFVMWEALPVGMDEIAQVEVLRGPGSAVWGANALSGVVHVRTKSPRDMPGGRVELAAGEVGTRSLSARWAQALTKYSYKVSASWFQQDAWPRENTFADGQPIPEEFEFRNEGTELPKVDVRVDRDADGRRWTWQVGRAGTSGLMHTGIGPFRISRGSVLASVYSRYRGPATEAVLYVNHLDGDADNLLNGLPFAFETRTFVADVTHRLEPGPRHALSVGANLRANRFDLSLAPGEGARDEGGLFAEDVVQVTSALALSMGVRMDWVDVTGWTASPRTSLVWKPRPDHALRLAYNRAFRSPSLINNYLDTAVPNRATLPNGNDFAFVSFASGTSDLREETVDAFEIGYTGYLGSSILTAAVFTNVTGDLIEFAPAEYYSAEDPPSGLAPEDVPERELVKRYAYRNAGEVRDRGLELSLDTLWAPGVLMTASYTYQEPTQVLRDDPDEPIVTNLAPRHQASVQLSVKRGRWSGSLGVNYAGEAFWADVLDERFWGTSEAHVLVSGALGCTLLGDRAELRVSGTNLLDDPVKQHVFGDIIGRKLTASIRYRF